MARPGQVEQPPLRRLDIPHRLQETAGRIGLTELTTGEIRKRVGDIGDRIKIGLSRKGKPQMVTEGPEAGMASDRGFAALESGVHLTSSEEWRQVPVGREAYVASIGGTNSDFYKLTKLSDTEIGREKLDRKVFDEKADKPMPFAEFIDNVVEPIAADYKSKKGPKGRLRVAVSLAFGHENLESPDGIDAAFLPVDNQGTLSKKWKITDWPRLAPKDRRFIEAMKAGFERQGIDVDDVDIDLIDPSDKSKMAVLNDTLLTLMNSNAAERARKDGFKLLKIGGVGGTGTNLAVDQDGLVNLEFGRYPLPLDDEGRADRVTERVLDIIHAENLEKDPSAKRGKAEMEIETGGMYMSYRLRAGLQIFGEEGVLPNASEHEAWVKEQSVSNPTFISDLAVKEGYGDDLLKFMARGMLHRAGQNFGLSVAAVANVLYGDRSKDAPAAILVEGSFVNHGAGVKRTAEAYSYLQGQPIVIYEADSIEGAAAKVMSL